MVKEDPSGTSGALPARRKGRERRQTIIDTAREMLISRGMSGLVLRDVADQLGITHGNLQYYFQTKEDLLVAVFDQEILKYTDSLHAASRRASSKRGKIAAIIDAGFAQLRSDSTRLWRMLIGLADESPALANILRELNLRYDRELMEEILALAPGLSNERVAHVAQMVRLFLDGFAIQLAWDNQDNPEVRALESEVKAVITSLILD
jgi:AcrR family transcriptional regulator